MKIKKDMLFLVRTQVEELGHIHEERDPPLNNFPPYIYINKNTLALAGVFFINDMMRNDLISS
jgi:hypothetical protein